MPSMRTWLLSIVCCNFASGILLGGCASAPRVLAIPPASENVRPAIQRINDYPDALAAIVFVMVRDLKLPAVEGTVTLYSNRFSFESALAAELEKDLESTEKQLDTQARETFKSETIPNFARQVAVSSMAVGMNGRVLVNESYFQKLGWPESVRILAHELTHTMERAVMNGRLTAPDTWLREGFAEWVSYKVVDALGVETFQKNRDRRVDFVATARQYQTFPVLTQLAAATDWRTWMRTLGLEATYGQALLAVDLLIEEKGLPAVVEYFRLFGTLNNRRVNFTRAFGEPLSAFEGKFDQRLRELLGK